MRTASDRMVSRRIVLALIAIEAIVNEIMVALTLFVCVHLQLKRIRRRRLENRRRSYSLTSRIPAQVKHLHRLVIDNDQSCVAIFLSIIAHHKKSSVVKHDFIRSSRTVSKAFHNVLYGILRLNRTFLARPTSIFEDCLDPRWRWLKGCLGALDGTYIDVRVPEVDKARYRTRKGHIAVNVLGVCNTNMEFIYVLTGWEGSAADSRVLRDAINRPMGLRIPTGNYYLCDNGYINGHGFLTPYRGVRYHLSEWDRGAAGPQNKEEFFNLRHSSARNVIEHDPLEDEISLPGESQNDSNAASISSVETNPVWRTWRDELTQNMYTDWLACRG
ncbi:UNVERIFIED_CONTAM: hypothetical protein Slati_0210200 [Sesamum latifolium]|uniref:DDE Tnp4 domain-containing protein n=1 Tax=Sesamum latifolium TaxID=2727402 RepID=A0AAW2YBH8_9LAMI